MEYRGGEEDYTEGGKIAVQKCKSAYGLWKSGKVDARIGRGVAG